MQLSPLQLQQYKTFGFLIIRDFLSPEWVQNLRDALTRLKTEESGEADPLEHRGRVVGMFDNDPLHVQLFDDLRLYAIAEQLLPAEKSVKFLGDEYASFSTPADWHPDMSPTTPFESLKFGFYLDDISQGGFLNVIPGSHHPEFSKSIAELRGSQTPPPPIENAFACMTQPGDLLVFNLRIWHEGTANPARTHRRVLFWSVGQGIPEFDKFAQIFHNKRGRGNPEEAWPELMIKNAPPHRRSMLDVYEPDTVKHCELV